MPGHGPVPATAGHGDIEAADRCDRATGMSLSVVTMAAPGRLNLTRKVAAGPAAAAARPRRWRPRPAGGPGTVTGTGSHCVPACGRPGPATEVLRRDRRRTLSHESCQTVVPGHGRVSCAATEPPGPR